MSAPQQTTTQAKPTDTCPPWCVAPHSRDTDYVRQHLSDELNPTFRRYGQLRWDERLDGDRDKGALVWLQVREHEVPLEPWRAGLLAEVLAELEGDAAEMAGLLRDVLRQADDPQPGSEIPDRPGYVVATCGHPLTAREWRLGYRTCEDCGHDWEDLGNGAGFFACEHETLDDPGHDNDVCPRLTEEQMQAVMHGGAQ